MAMPEKQRKEYQAKLGYGIIERLDGEGLEISRRRFDKKTKGIAATPAQAEAAFQKENRKRFREGLLKAAKDNGIEGSDFYGMLDKGCMPHEVDTKGFRLFGNKKFLVPGKSENKEMTASEFGEFIKKAGEEYDKKIILLAKNELEGKWDKGHARLVRDEMEHAIAELARSPEKAKGGVEALYAKARERIVEELLAKRKAEAKKTPDAKEQKAIDAEFGNGKKAGAKPEKPVKSPDEFISDTIRDGEGILGGGLEELTGDFDEDVDSLSAYFNELGVTEMTPAKLGRVIDKKIYKKQSN